MKLHGNAALSWNGRRLLVERVVVEGWTLRAAAEAAGVSVRCGRKWVGRYRGEGELGLRDRSSAPKRIANRTAPPPRIGSPPAPGGCDASFKSGPACSWPGSSTQSPSSPNRPPTTNCSHSSRPSRVLHAWSMVAGTRQRFAANRRQAVSATKPLARSGGLSASTPATPMRSPSWLGTNRTSSEHFSVHSRSCSACNPRFLMPTSLHLLHPADRRSDGPLRPGRPAF